MSHGDKVISPNQNGRVGAKKSAKVALFVKLEPVSILEDFGASFGECHRLIEAQRAANL
jgi:hypothetical protein